MALQAVGASPPTGVVAPSPVMPTRVGSLGTPAPPSASYVLVGITRRHLTPAGPRRRALLVPESGRYGGPPDAVDDVLYRLEVLELVVGDFHAEVVLRGHRDLDHRKAVDGWGICEGL